MRRFKRVDQLYQDRLVLNEAYMSYEAERIEKEYIDEKKSAVREFEERKIELKEALIGDLEEKRRMIEMERTSLELMSEATEPKPPTTRKLRRRPNDPVPVPEKRKRGSPAQLNHLLDENDILEDLRALSKVINNSKYGYETPSDTETGPNVVEARIEDGKLYYDKKWYHRGQPVLVKSRDGDFIGTLASIGNAEIFIKKTHDNSKFRITLSHLQKGKHTLQRRAS
jgi:Sin3 histone deacetylase corepressor complex component SDS3